jgi:hypothetical protein
VYAHFTVTAFSNWQDISVANPPTLLLAVQSLLRRCSAYDAAAAVDDSTTTTTAAAAAQQRRLAFLQRATPVLDQWVQWLLNTQRHPQAAASSAAAAHMSDSLSPEVCTYNRLSRHHTGAHSSSTRV